MKKSISVKPVTEIELQFEDGKNLNLKFDVEAISNFNDLDGGIVGYVKDSRLPEQCAKIIYIGAKASESDFTLEKAREIVSQLSPVTITEIMEEFNESMGSTKNEVQSEIQKKLMSQFTNQSAK